MSQTVSADDRAQMLDMLGKYFWSADTGDVEGIVAVFTKDGVISFEDGQRLEEPRAFALRISADAHLRRRMHFNTPLFFEASGEEVVVRSFVKTMKIDPDAPSHPAAALAYTDDRFVRTEDGWRIRVRAISRWKSE